MKRFVLFSSLCNFLLIFIWTKQTEMAERLGDKEATSLATTWGSPPFGGQAQEDSILCTLGGRKTTVAWQHRESTTDMQPRPRSSKSCHVFKQGSNGTIMMKEWVIRTFENATCVDQSPKTRWDRRISVDINRNRGLRNRGVCPHLPLAFKTNNSLILALTSENGRKES